MNTIFSFFTAITLFFSSLVGGGVAKNQVVTSPSAQATSSVISSVTSSSTVGITNVSSPISITKDLYSERYQIKDGKVIYSFVSMDNPRNRWETQMTTLEANPQAFKIVQDIKLRCTMNPISKDDRRVFYGGQVIKGADPSTFTTIDAGFSKDKANVYYKGVVISKADIKSFSTMKTSEKDTCGGVVASLAEDANNLFCTTFNNEVLALDKKISTSIDANFIKSGNTLYYGCTPYSQINKRAATLIDVPTLVAIPGSIYYKDKNGVYAYNGYMDMNDFIPLHADRNTFQPLPNGFSRDKESLYYTFNYPATKIQNSDPDSFVILNDMYSKDNRNVYATIRPLEKEGQSQVTVIKDADTRSFESMPTSSSWYKYAKDINHVYYQNIIIPNLDPRTLRLFKEYPQLIGDNNVIYLVNPYNPDKFIQLKDVDATTFSIAKTDPTQAKDKNNTYKIETSDKYGESIIFRKVAQ